MGEIKQSPGDLPAEDGATELRIPARVFTAKIVVDGKPKATPGPSRQTLGGLWASADFGACKTGRPVLVWPSKKTLAERMGLGATSTRDNLATLAAAGFVVSVQGMTTAQRETIGLVVRADPAERGQWLQVPITCMCRQPSQRCTCRVLIPIGKDGRPTLLLPAMLDQRAEHDAAALAIVAWAMDNPGPSLAPKLPRAAARLAVVDLVVVPDPEPQPEPIAAVASREADLDTGADVEPEPQPTPATTEQPEQLDADQEPEPEPLPREADLDTSHAIAKQPIAAAADQEPEQLDDLSPVSPSPKPRKKAPPRVAPVEPAAAAAVAVEPGDTRGAKLAAARLYERHYDARRAAQIAAGGRPSALARTPKTIKAITGKIAARVFEHGEAECERVLESRIAAWADPSQLEWSTDTMWRPANFERDLDRLDARSLAAVAAPRMHPASLAAPTGVAVARVDGLDVDGWDQIMASVEPDQVGRWTHLARDARWRAWMLEAMADLGLQPAQVAAALVHWDREAVDGVHANMPGAREIWSFKARDWLRVAAGLPARNTGKNAWGSLDGGASMVPTGHITAPMSRAEILGLPSPEQRARDQREQYQRDALAREYEAIYDTKPLPKPEPAKPSGPEICRGCTITPVAPGLGWCHPCAVRLGHVEPYDPGAYTPPERSTSTRARAAAPASILDDEIPF